VSLADRLGGTRLLFLDTAPVIYYVEGHPTYAPELQPVFAAIDRGEIVAVTSPITLAECLVLPFTDDNERAEALFFNLIVKKAMFIGTDPSIAVAAAKLRASLGLSLPDALQIATATAVGCHTFLTNDKRLRSVAAINAIVLEGPD
jgi:predicted nucleic acid-binding protein